MELKVLEVKIFFQISKDICSQRWEKKVYWFYEALCKTCCTPMIRENQSEIRFGNIQLCFVQLIQTYLSKKQWKLKNLFICRPYKRIWFSQKCLHGIHVVIAEGGPPRKWRRIKFDDIRDSTRVAKFANEGNTNWTGNSIGVGIRTQRRERVINKYWLHVDLPPIRTGR